MFGHNDQGDDQNNGQHSNNNDQSQPLGGLGNPPGSDYGDSSQQQPQASDSTDQSSDSVDQQPAHNDFAHLIADGPKDDSGDNSTNDLIDLKSKALQQLTPLVGHLDQSPEEKFRTTMMMIQASDNQDLIKTAYDAAQAIPNEKAKAQALLDVVNEINYFTQNQTS
jgi:hypothetical protein